MEYWIYFDCSDLNSGVLSLAASYHQTITGISVTNDDMLCIEFSGYRRFERDMFLAYLNAHKSDVFYDRYEVKAE